MIPTSTRVINDATMQARINRQRTLREALLAKAGCEIVSIRTVSDATTGKAIEEEWQPISLESYTLQTDPYRHADDKECTYFTVQYHNVEGIGMIPSMTAVKTAATEEWRTARIITTEYQIHETADAVAKNRQAIGVLLKDLRNFNQMMTRILTREMRNDMILITWHSLDKNSSSHASARIDPYNYIPLMEAPVGASREDMTLTHKWEHTPAGWTVTEIRTDSGSQSEQSAFDFVIGAKNTLPDATVFYVRKKLDGEIPIGRICRIDYDPVKLFHATDTVTGRRFYIYRNCLEDSEVWDILDELPS